MEKDLISIKEIIEEFINKLNVDFDEIEINNENENNFRFIIKTNDSEVLIGSEGNNIKALNHLIRQMVWKKKTETSKNIRFFVDINDYHTKNIERIKTDAIQTSKKAITFKKDQEMNPMTSFERLVVHSTLTDYPNISTESTGEGKFRRVVIKFIPTS